MPSSIALSTTLREASRSMRPPKLLHPIPTTETSRPDDPRLRSSIIRLPLEDDTGSGCRPPTESGPRRSGRPRTLKPIEPRRVLDQDLVAIRLVRRPLEQQIEHFGIA